MLPHEIAAQAVMRRTYGADVAYAGAGLNGDTVTAIRSDTRAKTLQGFDGPDQGLSFEIEKAALPQDAENGDLIVEASGARWTVIDANYRPDLDAWVVWVEEAQPE